MAKFEYPYSDLRNSVEVVEVIKNSGGKAKLGTIAQGLKMAETGGAFLMKVNSAKAFGLVEGRGDIELTPLAKKYLMPLTPEEKTAALGEAFLIPPLYRAIYDRFTGKELNFPDVKTLGNILVREHNVSNRIGKGIASIFLRSAEFAGITSKSSMPNNDTSSKSNYLPPTGSSLPDKVIRIAIQAKGYSGNFDIVQPADWIVFDAVVSSLKSKTQNENASGETK